MDENLLRLLDEIAALLPTEQGGKFLIDFNDILCNPYGLSDIETLDGYTCGVTVKAYNTKTDIAERIPPSGIKHKFTYTLKNIEFSLSKN